MNKINLFVFIFCVRKLGFCLKKVCVCTDFGLYLINEFESGVWHGFNFNKFVFLMIVLMWESLLWWMVEEYGWWCLVDGSNF